MSTIRSVAPLPTEPGKYVGQGGGLWELDRDGQWWFRGYDRPWHPTPDQQDRTEADVRTYGMPLAVAPESPVPSTPGTCGTVLGYLRDGRTPIMCMLGEHADTDHVAHVRQGSHG